MKKLLPTFMIIVVTIILVNVFIEDENVPEASNIKEERWERVASVLSNGFDEFGLFSFQADVEESIIWIEMDEAKSELSLKEYLKDNVDKSDLKHYKLEISKKGLHEVETEMFMSKVSHIVFDYIKEKDYKDVQIQHPSIEPEPLLTITISKNSQLSSEDLQKDLEELLISKNSELPNKDIPYKIKVVKG